MRAKPNHREVAQQTEIPTRTEVLRRLDENLMDQRANEAKRVLPQSRGVRKAAKPKRMALARPVMLPSLSAKAHVLNPRGDKFDLFIELSRALTTEEGIRTLFLHAI
jgi:hypothetical protein